LKGAKPDDIANSFYCIASNSPKAHEKKKLLDLNHDLKQRFAFMKEYEDKLKEVSP